MANKEKNLPKLDKNKVGDAMCYFFNLVSCWATSSQCYLLKVWQFSHQVACVHLIGFSKKPECVLQALACYWLGLVVLLACSILGAGSSVTCLGIIVKVWVLPGAGADVPVGCRPTAG